MSDDQLIIDIGARITDFAKSLDDANSTASKTFASIEQRGQQASEKLNASLTKVGSNKSLTLLSQGFAQAEKNAGALVTKVQTLKGMLDGTKGLALGKFGEGQNATALGLLQSVQAAGGLKAFTALSGGALGVGAIAAGYVAKQTKQLGELKAVADEARTTAAQVAGLQNVFGKLGVASDTTAKMLRTFADNLLDAKAHGGELKAALDAAGISFVQANGDLRPTIDVLGDLVRYMRNSTDEAAKLKLSTAAVGSELGGNFADAVKRGGSALDNLQVATNRVGSAITNDLAEMAQSGIRSLDGLWDHVNRLYSRMKELAGFQLTAGDQANVVAQHLQEAIGNRAGLDGAALFRDVSPKEIADANKRLFDAAAAFDKANPIRALPGGDPREKHAAPKPAPTPANDDDVLASSRRGGGRSTEKEDKAPAVIADLQRQLQLAQAEGDARHKITDEIKVANELKRAGVTADSAEGRQIAQLVQATNAATTAAKSHNEVLKARKETVDLIGGSLESSLGSITLHGGKLTTLFQSLAETLAKSALQAALLGNGPLANLFGGDTAATSTSAGGLLGGFAHLLGFAGGGEIAGPGTGTSDSILARLSAGEFVVNAKSAQDHLPLLHAINRGGVPKFATGGLVAAISTPSLGGGSFSQGGAAAVTLHNNVTVNATGGSPAANADLAKQVGAHVEAITRQTVIKELRNQMRPGNILQNVR